MAADGVTVNVLAPAARSLRSACLLCGPFPQRKAYLETSVAGPGLHLQVSVVAVHHDPPADVESEAGSLADGFGGEKRFEDSPGGFGWDTGSGVTDLDHGELTVAGGAHSEGALPVHGVDGIIDEVGPHLVELGGVGGYSG